MPDGPGIIAILAGAEDQHRVPLVQVEGQHVGGSGQAIPEASGPARGRRGSGSAGECFDRRLGGVGGQHADPAGLLGGYEEDPALVGQPAAEPAGGPFDPLGGTPGAKAILIGPAVQQGDDFLRAWIGEVHPGTAGCGLEERFQAGGRVGTGLCHRMTFRGHAAARRTMREIFLHNHTAGCKY